MIISNSTHASVEHYGSILINSDCISGAQEIIEDDSVDLIITDPPYGIGGDQLHKHYNRDESFVVDGYIEIPANKYNEFSKNWLRQAERVLKPGGAIYIVSGYTNLFDVLDGLRATKLREINHIIWKYNFGVYTSAKYVSSHYHILYYEKPGKRRTFNLQSRFSTDESAETGGSLNYRDREDVWLINREYKPGQKKNKNELPNALLQKILQYSSNEGDLVADFFMGGGSTGVVSIGMNRRFLGFEASRSAFEHCNSQVTDVKPGDMLDRIRSPIATITANQGRSWSDEERVRLRSRFEVLISKGQTKKIAIETLCEEFGRGKWAVLKNVNDMRRTFSSDRGLEQSLFNI